YACLPNLVLKPYVDEDPWGLPDVQWMMDLALADKHQLGEDQITMEDGARQVEDHERSVGGVYLLANALLQEEVARNVGQDQERGENVIYEGEDDDFEEGEIKEVFRAEEYDGVYLELGMFFSCEMRERDASEKVLKMRPSFLVRDGHLFMKSKGRNPRRVVCGIARQIDVMAALHDGTAGGHRSTDTTHATFPIESFLKTWRRQDLESELTFEELLDLRARQIGAIEDRIEGAASKVAYNRAQDKFRWDKMTRVRKESFRVGDTVLLYDSFLEKQWSRKLDKRWLGPYKVARVGEHGAYQIEEIDGTAWRDWVSGSRLKKFVARDEPQKMHMEGKAKSEEFEWQMSSTVTLQQVRRGLDVTQQAELVRDEGALPIDRMVAEGQMIQGSKVEAEQGIGQETCQDSTMPQGTPLVANFEEALGSWATWSGSAVRTSGPARQTEERAACPTPSETPQQEVTSEVTAISSSVLSQEEEKTTQKKPEKCLYCKKGKHFSDDCPKFYEDEARGFVTRVSTGIWRDRNGNLVERSCDGGRMQLYGQIGEVMID
ncbi:hypothetical protein CBR_g78272, partial [Chara braunii]